MKKMKNLKKIMALLLALVMVMGMTTTVMAADEVPVTSGPVKVFGVEEEEGVNITVTAYQILKYNPNGYYEEVIKDTIDWTPDSTVAEGTPDEQVKDNQKMWAPTPENIQALEAQKDNLTNNKQLTKTNEDGNVVYTSSDLEPGSWMIIVTGSKKYVYNPAIVSVNVTPDGNVAGTVDLEQPWSSTTYLKKSEPTFKKEAVTPNVEGVQYGDVIEFLITADIPSYGDEQENIVYKITDTLEGLTLVNEGGYLAEATVGTNKQNAQSDNELTTAVETGIKTGIAAGGKSFSVDMSNKDEWIKERGGQKIFLTYFAKVTSDAKLTVDELNNKAKLEYSTHDGTGTLSDDTIHYTFGIDTNITGKTGEKITSGEFIKMNNKGDVEYNQTRDDVTFTDADGKALEGAEFKLVYDKDGTEVEFENPTGVNRFTTDATGRLEINGLDSDITYYLIETIPPKGYTLDDRKIPVKIDATYNKDGILESYEVKIDGKLTAHYKWNGTTSTIEGDPSNPMNPFGFKNTKLVKLPSTGGIGTTIFTIAGCVIMIAAVGLFFASRKKK